MELLDRYLCSVGKLLPRNQQDDLLAEISEDIRSQIEEQESEGGHKLDEAEMALLLIRRGHPLAVAVRYMPQRHLIGPILFPHWLFLLKMVVSWIFAIFLFRVILAPMPIDGALVFRTLGGFIQACWVALGVITLIFALFERSPAYARFKVPEVWDPRALPVYTPPSPAALEVPIIVSGIFWAAVWVWFFQFHPVFHFSGGEVSATPAFAGFFWPFLLTVLASFALALVAFMRKAPPARLFAAIRLAVDAACLIVLFLLLRAGTLIEPGGPVPVHILGGHIGEIAGKMNDGIRVTLIVCAILVAGHAWIEVRLAFRSTGRQRPGTLAKSAG
jgi:hypothetical protein